MVEQIPGFQKSSANHQSSSSQETSWQAGVEQASRNAEEDSSVIPHEPVLAGAEMDV